MAVSRAGGMIVRWYRKLLRWLGSMTQNTKVPTLPTPVTIQVPEDYATITSAVAAATDGVSTIIDVADGTYAEQVTIDGRVFTQRNPLIIRSRNLYGAVIDGSDARPHCVKITGDSAWVTVERFHMKRAQNSAVRLDGEYGSNLNGWSDNCTVQNCKFDDLDYDSVVQAILNAGRNNKLIGNDVTGTTSHGIYCDGNNDGSEINGNYVYQCGKSGLRLEGSNMRIQNNRIYDCQQAGIGFYINAGLANGPVDIVGNDIRGNGLEGGTYANLRAIDDGANTDTPANIYARDNLISAVSPLGGGTSPYNVRVTHLVYNDGLDASARNARGKIDGTNFPAMNTLLTAATNANVYP